MDKSVIMACGKPPQHISRDAQGDGWCHELLCNIPVEGKPIHVFHIDRETVFHHLKIVDMHDVRVDHARDQSRFLAKAFDELLVTAESGIQDLEGDLAL
jgi:hypothetical protein